MSEITDNKVVSVHYTGTLPENGEIFDSSEGRDPLTFLVGHKQMIPGFEREMLGAKTGEKREFTLNSDDAYGDYAEDGVKELNVKDFPDGIEVGMTMAAQDEMGREMPFKILSIKDETVTVDFNHPLAGKSLTFNVEVVDIKDASEEEIAHGHAHGPGGHNH